MWHDLVQSVRHSAPECNGWDYLPAVTHERVIMTTQVLLPLQPRNSIHGVSCRILNLRKKHDTYDNFDVKSQRPGYWEETIYK